MPPFIVQYLCPSQGWFWQGPQNGRPFLNFYSACRFADAIKPGRGWARVLDGRGQRVYPAILPAGLPA